ncbi:uncharacterized protein V1510DRAFT_414610 [Dipodascopsis tothii]|uniref:uncharacterized protein n=1 Tax=Dipodascopsis tothii TaxID=44089 RepID=UPI0034CF2E30
MELKFVVVDAGEDPRLRQRSAHRACQFCKRRKRKCTHVAAASGSQNENERQRSGRSLSRDEADASWAHETTDDHNYGQRETTTSSGEKRREPNSPDAELASRMDGTSKRLRRSTSPQADRFVGDLNPESVFLTRANHETSVSRVDKDEVGVWLDRDDQENDDHLVDGEDAESTAPNRSYSLDSTRDMTVTELIAKMNFTLPPPDDQQALIEIFFTTIHPLLPIVDEDEFRSALKANSVSPVLLQAINLVVCKDNFAGTHLRLGTDEEIMAPKRFGRIVYTQLNDVIAKKLLRNKITLIRTLALMALHTESSDGPEEASWHLAHAIHNAQTVGLHLTQKAHHSHSSKSLFWSLWSLDRLNAAINGRPVILNDRDNGRNFQEELPQQIPSFQIWLTISKLLDDAIGLYRPSVDPSVTGFETDMPGFEEIVEKRNGWNIGPHLLASLELYYHATSILSCRSRSRKGRPPFTTSYIRQSLSAIHIMNIAKHRAVSGLVPLPVIPYAVALSFSVGYKNLSHTKLQTAMEAARDHLQLGYQILLELGKIWWSAKVMAMLGRKTLGEIDRLQIGYGSEQSAQRNHSIAGHSTVDQTINTRSRSRLDEDTLNPQPANDQQSTDVRAYVGLPTSGTDTRNGGQTHSDIQWTAQELPDPFLMADDSFQTIGAFLENILDLNSSNDINENFLLDEMDVTQLSD